MKKFIIIIISFSIFTIQAQNKQYFTESFSNSNGYSGTVKISFYPLTYGSKYLLAKLENITIKSVEKNGKFFSANDLVEYGITFPVQTSKGYIGGETTGRVGITLPPGRVGTFPDGVLSFYSDFKFGTIHGLGGSWGRDQASIEFYESVEERMRDLRKSGDQTDYWKKTGWVSSIYINNEVNFIDLSMKIDGAIRKYLKKEEIDKKVEDLVYEGGSEVIYKNYSKALENYNKAYALRNDPSIKEKIEDTKRLIEEKKEDEKEDEKEKELEAKKEEVFNIVKAGDKSYENNNFTEALNYYLKASEIQKSFGINGNHITPGEVEDRIEKTKKQIGENSNAIVAERIVLGGSGSGGKLKTEKQTKNKQQSINKRKETRSENKPREKSLNEIAYEYIDKGDKAAAAGNKQAAYEYYERAEAINIDMTDEEKLLLSVKSTANIISSTHFGDTGTFGGLSASFLDHYSILILGKEDYTKGFWFGFGFGFFYSPNISYRGINEGGSYLKSSYYGIITNIDLGYKFRIKDFIIKAGIDGGFKTGVFSEKPEDGSTINSGYSYGPVLQMEYILKEDRKGYKRRKTIGIKVIFNNDFNFFFEDYEYRIGDTYENYQYVEDFPNYFNLSLIYNWR